MLPFILGVALAAGPVCKLQGSLTVDLFARAKVAWAAGDLKPAINCYSDIIKIDPSNSEAYLWRGTSFVALLKADAAIADLNKAIELDPKLSLAFTNRGAAYLLVENYEAAIRDFTEAIKDDGTAPRYANRAFAYLRADQIEKAFVDASEAIRRDADYGPAYSTRGMVFFKRKQYDRALADLGKSISLFPAAEAYQNRGWVLQAMGQEQAALNDFSAALKMNPGSAEFHADRAASYYKMRKYQLALKDWESALQLQPDHIVAHAELARCFACCPDAEFRDSAKALVHARRVCVLTSWKEQAALCLLAQAYASANKFAEAVEWQKMALGLPTGKRSEDVGKLQRQLNAYRAGKPFLEYED